MIYPRIVVRTLPSTGNRVITMARITSSVARIDQVLPPHPPLLLLSGTLAVCMRLLLP